MATVRIEAELSSEDLLKAAAQLSPRDLEEFVQRILALQAQRRAPSLAEAETELILKINQGAPSELQVRYDELVAKRRAETLTPDEHAELLRLTEQMEGLELQRVECLAALARLRQTSLTAVMDALGIRPPQHA
jgi:hypothetical protein